MNAPWSISRPNVKVLDCTIRDGGLVNNHRFSDKFVRAVYDTCVAAGIDYMEIGYKNSDQFFSRSEMGPWKFCDEEDMRRVVGDNPSKLKLSCMADAGKSNWKHDIIPASQSVLDMIRVAFYDYQLDEALDMIQDASEKGYEVSANMMAISVVDEVTLDKCLERLANSAASTIVVVDSYGFLITEQTEYLIKKYIRFASKNNKEVGMHAHNNQQLAFANTIESMRHGTTRVDATIGGLGRGAGNCPMELLLAFLKDNPKYQLRPIYECLENEFVALQKEIEWGPYPEYMITGFFNQHPRAAIKARDSIETKDHYVQFFDQIMNSESK